VAFGLTNEGFTSPRLEDIIRDQRQKANDIFADLIAVSGDSVDTSDSSLLGRLIALDASGDADLWEALHQVYSSFDPNSAVGVALDNIVQYGSINRYAQKLASAYVMLGGSNGAVIPAGSVVKSASNNEFLITSAITLNSSLVNSVVVKVTTVQNLATYSITYVTNNALGVATSNTVVYTSDATATSAEVLSGLLANVQLQHPLLQASVVSNELVITVADIYQPTTFTSTLNLEFTKIKKLGEIKAVLYGEVTQEVGSINQIVTPVLGWDSVANTSSPSGGRLTETDAELRLRFRNTKFERAINSVESLYSAITLVSGVSSFAVYENDTGSTNSIGLPPHSFQAIVEGGLSADIATALWQNKPAGITSFGNTPTTILDSNGFEHIIRFSRPTLSNIKVEISLTKYEGFPANGEDVIRENISKFLTSLKIGEDVVYSRLYTPINAVPGHQVNSLRIGTSTLGYSNIIIPFDGVADTNSSNIVFI
jgi:uncharacterized phage protein gp47/JayE